MERLVQCQSPGKLDVTVVHLVEPQVERDRHEQEGHAERVEHQVGAAADTDEPGDARGRVGEQDGEDAERRSRRA